MLRNHSLGVSEAGIQAETGEINLFLKKKNTDKAEKMALPVFLDGITNMKLSGVRYPRERLPLYTSQKKKTA